MKTLKTFLTSILIATLVACGGGGGGSGSFPIIVAPPATAPVVVPKDCSITVHGDSIMRASGEPGKSTSNKINALIPHARIVDLSVAGQSAAVLNGFFYNYNRDTKYVLFESGVIDSWQGRDVTPIYRNFISYVRAEGRTPIITGFSHQMVGTLDGGSMVGRDIGNASLKALAKELNVPFVDWDTVEFRGYEDLSDTVHPVESYTDRLATRTADFLKTVAPECK